MKSKAYNAGAQAAAGGFTGPNPYDNDLALWWDQGFTQEQKDILQEEIENIIDEATDNTADIGVTQGDITRAAAKLLMERKPWNARHDTQGDPVSAPEVESVSKTVHLESAGRFMVQIDCLVEALADIYSTTTDGATALKAKAALAKAGVK